MLNDNNINVERTEKERGKSRDHVLHKRWTFIQPDVRNCGKGILKMKKILSFVLMMCVLMTIPMFAFAAVSGDEPLTIGTPFMITNAGQGPGGKMGRLLVSRAGTLTEDEDFYYVDVPYAADVDARDYSAIVIVIGSTDKGLGATGITIDQEIARVDEVVARANEKGVPVIAVMLEKDKRSDVKTNSNERCIDAVCPHAAWMIVTADVNTDGRYDAFKAENGTPLTILDSSMDFISLVQQAFVKE